MVNGYGAPGFPVHPQPADGALLGLSLRAPPTNLRAEQSLIGALMGNNAALDQVLGVLAPEHFADALHGALFAAIQRRVEAGRVADFLTLRPEFEADPRLVEAGGVRYLAQLLSANVSTLNVAAYARMVRDLWTRRQLIDLGEEVVNLAFGAEPELEAPGMMEHLEQRLTALADTQGGHESADGMTVAKEVEAELMAALDRRGALGGLTTGYAGLDRMTGGLRPGQFIIVGARPAMGKTALVAGIALRAAAAGARVYFWGGEMDRASVMSRGVAATAGLPLDAITRGAMWVGDRLEPLDRHGSEVKSLGDAAARVGSLPIQWDDQPALAVATLRSRLRRHKRRHGLDLVVVDYLGLLRGAPEWRKAGSRYLEMGDLSRSLKALAMELRVPVLCAAQLSRANEQRENKRPQLADLRDAGDIEQDADMVMFLHREHYYLVNGKPQRGKFATEEKYAEAALQWQQSVEAEEFRGEVNIAKQRQGRTGPVRMRWSPSMTWFFDESEAEGTGALPDVSA